MHCWWTLCLNTVAGMPTRIWILIWKECELQDVLKVIKIHKMAQHHTLLSVQMLYHQYQTESGKELINTLRLT